MFKNRNSCSLLFHTLVFTSLLGGCSLSSKYIIPQETIMLSESIDREQAVSLLSNNLKLVKGVTVFTPRHGVCESSVAGTCHKSILFDDLSELYINNEGIRIKNCFELGKQIGSVQHTKTYEKIRVNETKMRSFNDVRVIQYWHHLGKTTCYPGYTHTVIAQGFSDAEGLVLCVKSLSEFSAAAKKLMTNAEFSQMGE